MSMNKKIILVDAVNCFVSEEGQIFSEMKDLLDKYSNKKIILTGANDEQFKKFKLDTMPYEVFTLKHNPEKTDPKYFEIMLSKFNLKSDDVIYFEHAQESVKSAQTIGIKTYYYDNDKKDLEGLKSFLDLNIN
jgi:HAD superfamily hydrolase (TIGR01509 family)